MPSPGTPRDFESGTRAAAEPASLTKRLQTRHLAATCVCNGRRTSYESVTKVQISCWGSHEGQTSIRGDCRDRLRRRRILIDSRVESIDQRAGRELDAAAQDAPDAGRSEEHTSELQSRGHLVCRLLLEKKKSHSRGATAVGNRRKRAH